VRTRTGVGWDMSPSGTELPIQNVCSSIANGGKADKICEAPGDRQGVEGESPLR